MPDYKFEALNTRSFEQLVQSLAQRILTPGLTPFGDGPDGGREATFDGPVEYQTTGPKWAGYGIIQAKFLQRPLGTDRDGPWALAQLRGELAEFEKSDSPRTMPQYYIFVTNATLSSVNGVGAKDQAKALLADFATRNGLAGVDVWDYDKLRTLVDVCDGVRASYDAWLTPGDVLAAVMDRLTQLSPDFHSLMTKLLARQLLDNQYARLEQAGHNADARVPLASVFVDLPFANREPIEGKTPPAANRPQLIATLLQAIDQRNDPASCAAAEADDSGSCRSRYVLIGGPGQGKTTSGQFLCQLLRAAILIDVPAHLLEPEVRQALRQLQQQCQAEHLELPRSRRFPVHVVLNELARYLAEAPSASRSLVGFIADRMTRRLKQPIVEEDLRGWLAGYPWLLILDGLDEVPASTNRADVVAVIWEFLTDARADNADLVVVATSRPQGYGKEFRAGEYDHLWLTPLPAPDALRYGKRLIDLRYGAESDRSAAVLAKLERAVKQDAVSRLMRTPLQVTIMTQLVDRVGQPPQERYTLFRAYYDVIYSRELEREIPAAALLRDYRGEIDSIHWRVGLALQARSELAGGTDARLSRDEFGTLVRARLVEEEHAEPELTRLIDEITEAAEQRLVFLVGHESDAIGFEIRSLQEFMAAEALFEGTDVLVQDRMREIAEFSHWRNVFLFAAGRCFTVQKALRDTVILICGELNEVHHGGWAASKRLNGSRLALELLQDHSCSRQPKYVRHLFDLASELLRLPPEPVHEDLAAIAVVLEQVADLRTQLDAALVPGNAEIVTTGVLRAALALVALGDSGLADRLVALQAAGTVPAEDFLNAALSAGASSLVESLLPQLLPDIDPRRRFSGFGQYTLRRLSERTAARDWESAALYVLTSPSWSQPRNRRRPTFGTDGPPVRRPLASAASRDPLRLLTDSPLRTPGWLALASAAKFTHSPSYQNLRSALRAAKEARWTAGDLRLYAPWPLASLMQMSANRPPGWADQIADGEYGTPADWQAAERRWANGVREADITYILSLPDGRPFDDQIGEVGFPLAELDCLGPQQVADADVQQLIALALEADPSNNRTLLARSLLKLYSFAERSLDSPEQATTYLQLLNLCPEQRPVVIDTTDRVLAALHRLLTPTELVMLHKHLHWVRYWSSNATVDLATLARQVLAVHREHPELPGPVHVIATVADACRLVELLRSPMSLTALTAGEFSQFALDRAMIELIQSAPDWNAISGLVALLGANADRRYMILHRADEIMTAQGADALARERLLRRAEDELGASLDEAMLPILRTIGSIKRSRLAERGGQLAIPASVIELTRPSKLVVAEVAQDR